MDKRTNLDAFLDSLDLNADNLTQNAPAILDAVNARLAEVEKILSSLHDISAMLGGSGQDELSKKALGEKQHLLELKDDLEKLIAETLRFRQKYGRALLQEQRGDKLKTAQDDDGFEATHEEISAEDQLSAQQEEIEGDGLEAEDAEQIGTDAEAEREPGSMLPAVIPQSLTGIGGIRMESTTPSLFETLDRMGSRQVSDLMPVPMPGLPKIGSVAEMKAEGQPIPQEVEKALVFLGEKVSILSFGDLKPDEVLHMQRFVEKKEKTGRDGIAGDLGAYASTVLMAAASYMRDDLPRQTVAILKEIELRERKGATYKPHQESLDRVAGAIMVVCRHLVNRNVDADLLDPSGILNRMLPTTVADDLKVDPLTILVLRETQLKVAAKRQVEYMEAIKPHYDALIAFHNDMVLKLRKRGLSLSHFFPDDIAGKISGHIRFLHSISSYGSNYGRFTPRQIQTSLETSHEYRQTVEMILGKSAELQDILKEDLVRDRGDVEMAKTELCLYLNDAKRNQKLAQNMTCSFHCVNFIMEIMDENKSYRGSIKLNRDSYISYPLANDILAKYMQMDPDARATLKEKIRTQADNAGSLNPDAILAVAAKFFEILDKYI